MISQLLQRQLDEAPGVAQTQRGLALTGFLAAISVSLLVFCAEVLCYVFFHNRRGITQQMKRPAKRRQFPPSFSGRNFFKIGKNCFNMLLNDPDVDVIGGDAFYFLRYLKMILRIFWPIFGFLMPVLIVINYTNGRGQDINGEKDNNQPDRVVGLDTLAFGNVRPQNAQLYAVHVYMAILVVWRFCFVVRSELESYADWKMKNSPSFAFRFELVSPVPPLLKGDVETQQERIPVRKYGDLRDLVRLQRRRRRVVHKFEKNFTKLIRCLVLKAAKSKEKREVQSATMKSLFETCTTSKIDSTRSAKVDSEAETLTGPQNSENSVERYEHENNEAQKLRNRCRDLYVQIQEMCADIKERQGAATNDRIADFALIRGETPYSKGLGNRFSVTKFNSMDDIVWENASLTWWEQNVRSTAVHIVLVAMILLWAVPVAWTAVLGQLDALIRNQPQLSYIKHRPQLHSVLAALAGVLPGLALALLLYLLSSFLELLSRWKGYKLRTEQAVFVQRFYFVFLFIQMVLVVSVASFFTASLHQFLLNLRRLQSVQSVLDLLTENLPSAANYFFCYIILQAIGKSSGVMLRIDVLLSVLWDKVEARAPRQMRLERERLDIVAWATEFPVYSTFASIGLIYSVIAPLISAFILFGFSLMLLAQRYSLAPARVGKLEGNDNLDDSTATNSHKPETNDAAGILFPIAVYQTFVGVYVMILCLAGLFFGVRDEAGRHCCTVHGVIMIFMLLAVMAFQISITKRYSKPCSDVLPPATEKLPPLPAPMSGHEVELWVATDDHDHFNKEKAEFGEEWVDANQSTSDAFEKKVKVPKFNIHLIYEKHGKRAKMDENGRVIFESSYRPDMTILPLNSL